MGLKPVSIEGKALYVRERRGLYSLVSLASPRGRQLSQLKIAGSNKILCREIRRGMEFGVNGHPCIDLARNFQGQRRADQIR